MSRIEYELLRRDRPELGMVDWMILSIQDRVRLAALSRDQLIGFYTAVKLTGSFPVTLSGFQDHVCE